MSVSLSPPAELPPTSTGPGAGGRGEFSGVCRAICVASAARPSLELFVYRISSISLSENLNWDLRSDDAFDPTLGFPAAVLVLG